MQKMFHLFLMSLLLVSRWTQSRRSPSTGSPCASKWKSWWNDGRESRNQVLFKFASRGWWVVENVTLVTFLCSWSGDSIDDDAIDHEQKRKSALTMALDIRHSKPDNVTSRVGRNCFIYVRWGQTFVKRLFCTMWRRCIRRKKDAVPA
jgi:hypothetical protein